MFATSNDTGISCEAIVVEVNFFFCRSVIIAIIELHVLLDIRIEDLLELEYLLVLGSKIVKILDVVQVVYNLEKAFVIDITKKIPDGHTILQVKCERINIIVY